MFFIYCIKNLIYSNPDEELSENQERENNTFFSLPNIYELFDSFKKNYLLIFLLLIEKF